jgi:hypothetical protein
MVPSGCQAALMPQALSPDPGIRIHDVVDGDTAWLEPLLALGREFFPDHAAMAARLRQKAAAPAAADPRFVHHQWLIEVTGQAAAAAGAAMCCFSYVPARNLGLGIYLAVRPAYRSLPVAGHSRLAGWLHAAIGQQLASDAARAGRPLPWGLAVEVSVPALVAQYWRYGLRVLPIAYREPHFPQGWRPLDNLADLPPITWQPAELGLFPCAGRAVDVAAPQLLTDVVAAFLIDHYGFPKESEHPEVQRMLAVASIAAASVAAASTVAVAPSLASAEGDHCG